MSEDILEINRMIQTATVGDGDQMLNICEKMLEKIAAMERETTALRERIVDLENP